MMTTPFALHQVTRHGRHGLAAVACLTSLWPSVFGTRPVNVVLVRAPDAPDSFDLAWSPPTLPRRPRRAGRAVLGPLAGGGVLPRVPPRRGGGQARNRVRRAMERTVLFGLVCYDLAIVWYAQHGHPPTTRPPAALAPWYRTKATPAVADILATLRRVLLAAQYRHGQAIAPTMAEILQVQAVWAATAAKSAKAQYSLSR